MSSHWHQIIQTLSLPQTSLKIPLHQTKRIQAAQHTHIPIRPNNSQSALSLINPIDLIGIFSFRRAVRLHLSELLDTAREVCPFESRCQGLQNDQIDDAGGEGVEDLGAGLQGFVGETAGVKEVVAGEDY